MAVTLNNAAKRQIIRKLNEQGYPSYARLLDLFDVYLTDDPGVVGYMLPGKAAITLNKGLSINQVSTIVRHEILHEYFTHHERTQKFDKEHPDLLPLGSDHEASNIAGDYEISNRGYTDADKNIARNIIMGEGENQKILRGLVTEDQYPGWENMTFEELYEKILEERKKDSEKFKKTLQQLQKISKKDIEDLEKEIDKQRQQQNQQGQGDGPQIKPNSGKDGQGDSGDGNNDDDKDQDKKDSTTNILDDLKNELDDIGDKLEKETNQNNYNSNKGDSGPFNTDAQIKKEEELAKRVEKIKEIFNDVKIEDKLTSESNRAKQKEKQDQRTKEIQRKDADPLRMFKLNLNRFVADQIQELRDDTHARINPAYEDSEFILPGQMYKENKFIPRINVYHDVSGSFSSEAKTEAAMKAIDTLNKYVQNGDIEIDRYYFADRVTTTRSGAGGGTRGTPILNHILNTKPTNVIIITDSDISDCSETVKVPGAVWMLFYDSKSQNIMDHLKGKKQNKYYLIEEY